MLSDLFAGDGFVNGLGDVRLVEPCAVAVLGLARSWKVKALLLGLASRAPGGTAVYRRIQDIQAQRRPDADQMLERALDLAALYRDGGGTIEGRDFLEVGTGWCPWVPLVLMAGGARGVVTLDVNPWLSHRTAVKTTRALLARTGRVAERLQLDARRIERLLGSAAAAGSLDAWMAATGIRYLALTDMCKAALPAESCDGVLSSNVLEHVPPDGLSAIHRESARVLRQGGLIAHRFNPQDHFSFTDRTITGANFLQFSQAEWRWLGGAGLAYHNRLRCPQHRRLIEDAGFEVTHRRTRPDPAAKQAIETGRLKVHADFAGMSPAELTDDYMWVVARKAGVTTSG
jgi:hypothetical protein